MKACKGCGIKKGKGDFYDHQDFCKVCYIANVSDWRKRNPHKIKEYRERSKERQRIYYRKWYAEHGRCRRLDYAECIKSWISSNPEAVRARQIIANEIEGGRLQRPVICSKCERECRLHAHHKDYTKPLEIQWLCPSCHKLLHNIEMNA